MDASLGGVPNITERLCRAACSVFCDLQSRFFVTRMTARFSLSTSGARRSRFAGESLPSWRARRRPDAMAARALYAASNVGC